MQSISVLSESISYGGVDDLLDQAKDPFYILSIVGPMRKGKSWLLNYLLSMQDFFPVGSGTACTSGLRVEFINYYTQDNGKDVYRPAAIIDAEGLGDIHANRDRDLSLLCLLLSGVILYNVQGYAPKEEILRSLDATLRSFEILADLDSEISLDNVKFGSLNVVIRDYHHHLTKHQIEDELFNFEEIPEAGSRKAHILERNAIRKRLRKYYSSLHVWLLPHPVSDIEKLKYEKSIPFSDVSSSFQNAFMEMKVAIQSQLSLNGGNPYRLKSTSEIKDMIGRILRAVSSDTLMLSSLVSILDSKVAQTYKNDLLSYYRKKMSNIDLPNQSIVETLDRMKNEAILRFTFLINNQDDSIQFPNIRDERICDFEREFQSIISETTLKNNAAKLQHVTERISSLIRDAQHMMNPTSSITYHENFDDIVHRVEESLLADEYYQSLPENVRADQLKTLQRHLEVLKPTHTLHDRLRALDRDKMIRDTIFDFQMNIQATLPKLHTQLDVEIQNFVASLGLEANDPEVMALIDAMRTFLSGYNSTLISNEISKILVHAEESARVMLKQYDIEQILNPSILVQLNFLTDDLLSSRAYTRDIFTSEDRKFLVERVETICRRIYMEEIERCKLLQNQLVTKIRYIISVEIELFEKKLQSLSLPCPSTKLMDSIQCLRSEVEHHLFESVKRDALSIVADTNFCMIQYEMEKKNFDTEVESRVLKFLEKNVKESEKAAEAILATSWRKYGEDLLRAAAAQASFASLSFSPSTEQFENLKDFFWTSQVNFICLQLLPLDVDKWNEKIFEEFQAISSEILASQQSLPPNILSEGLTSVNKMLVSRIRTMKQEMDALIKEIEELRQGKSNMQHSQLQSEGVKPQNDIFTSVEKSKNSATNIDDEKTKSSADDAKLTNASNSSTLFNHSVEASNSPSSPQTLRFTCDSCKKIIPAEEHRFESSSSKQVCCLSCYLDLYDNQENVKFNAIHMDKKVIDIGLRMRRLGDMGFSSTNYFANRQAMIDTLLQFNGELRQTITHLLRKENK